jgi:hypothetical protein
MASNQVVYRFQCPYERTNIKEEDDDLTTNSQFDVDNLFRLTKVTSILEIALAKARKDDSKIQIKDKQDLFHALNTETLTTILEQAADTLKSTEYLREINAGQDNDYTINYFIYMQLHKDSFSVKMPLQLITTAW